MKEVQTSLTKKQEQFCREYLVDLNGKRAAIRAGYSEKTAEVQVSKLLGNVLVQKVIEELKNTRGQPTKYRPDYCEQMIDYFDKKPGHDERIETKSGDIKVVYIAHDLPTLAGFACHIGVHRDTLHEWANKTDEEGELVHPEFSDAYKRAKDYQEHILITNGLKGGYQSNFAIFTAKNVLGWRDKSDLDIIAPVDQRITEEMSSDMAAQIYMASLHNLHGR